jgi:hypothetical protein
MLVSIGTGAAPTLGPEALAPETNIATTLVRPASGRNVRGRGRPGHQLRVVGRCIYGAVLDRELGNMMPRDEQGKVLSLARDLERHFLYARYDADRTEEGLQRLGLSNIDAEVARRLDAVARVEDLLRIGHAAAMEVRLVKQFGARVTRAA